MKKNIKNNCPEQTNNSAQNKKNGFTIIELLIVVSIIALLITLSIVEYSSYTVKARDAQRLSSVEAIQNALALYYQDNGKYPASDLSGTYSSNYGTWSDLTNPISLASKLYPYIELLPVDPINKLVGSINYLLYYDANSGDDFQTYGLMVAMESPSNYHYASDDLGFDSWTIVGKGNYYEVGQQPYLCNYASGYTGGNRRWLYGGSPLVCLGGTP
ncbi:MAG: type II secretion system protein [Patescibacteria group bacterium]